MMRPVSPRISLACISALVISRGTRARSAEPFTVEADDGPVALARYPADRTGARPAVLVVTRMPAVLELYGDADRNVPLAKGEELVALARNVGAQAEQVFYPGYQHGFDFSEKDPMSANTVVRVVRFFRSMLLAS